MEDLKLNESLSCKYNDVKGCRSLLSVCLHTVAIWIFTFHKISGFVKGDFEGQFQTTLQAKGINFLI